MVCQFSKKVLATWAAVVIAEEIDLDLHEHNPHNVTDTKVDDEEIDMNLGGDSEADPMGGLGDLFGAMGGEASEETKEIFATHDSNGDGKLDAAEFGEFLGETMWEMSAGQRGGKEYLEVGTGEDEMGMKEMDKNGDGKITKDEYKAGTGAAPGDGFLEMLDSNKSGGLEIEEFGFIVSMFNMSKGSQGDAAHGGCQSSCCGGDKHEEAVEEVEAVEENGQCQSSCCGSHEHVEEEVECAHSDLENPSCNAGTNSTSCCANDEL